MPTKSGSRKSKLTVKNEKLQVPAVKKPSNKPSDAQDYATFQRFIENLPVMFYAVSPTAPHTPIYISPTFKEFGYPLKDWFNDSEIWDRIIHPDDKERVLSETRAAMKKGKDIECECRVVCKNGRVVWIRDRSCFIKDETGQPLCWQGVILDVTERKEALDALQVSETRYRQLFESANDLIYVHDLKGNYISINQAAEKVFGYTQEEAMSLNMKDITAPDHLNLVRQKLSNKVKGSSGQTVYQVDCITKTGNRVSLEEIGRASC